MGDDSTPGHGRTQPLGCSACFFEKDTGHHKAPYRHDPGCLFSEEATRVDRFVQDCIDSAREELKLKKRLDTEFDEYEVEVDPLGGLSSRLETRFDLIPQRGLYEVARVMKHGNEVYGPVNWRVCEVETHINHALAHVNECLQHEYLNREELAHAALRLLMAIELL